MAIKPSTSIKSPQGPGGEALEKLINSLTKAHDAKAGMISTQPVGEAEKLLAVKAWQQVTYLVRCKPSEVGVAIEDPIRRIAKVGEGDIPRSGITEVRDATMKDLEAATPTKALVI